MVRLIALLAVAAGIAMLFGPRRLRWIFGAIAGLAVLYALLKLTGVIDATFPDRVP
jgi:hypothetical protein